MTSLLALAIILIICLILGDIFKPSYGRCRGCSGCALDDYLTSDHRVCKLEKRRLAYLKNRGNAGR
jgi:hypothetical protein